MSDGILADRPIGAGLIGDRRFWENFRPSQNVEVRKRHNYGLLAQLSALNNVAESIWRNYESVAAGSPISKEVAGIVADRSDVRRPSQNEDVSSIDEIRRTQAPMPDHMEDWERELIAWVRAQEGQQ
jgi:hypothetical protein